MFIDDYYMILKFDEDETMLVIGEPSDCVYVITGKVVGLGENNRYTLAGKFKAFYLDADTAQAEGIPIFHIYDEQSETVDYFTAIYSVRRGEISFSDRLCRLLGDAPYWGNVLILDRLEILPKFRKHNLGLLVMRRLIERYRAGVEIVAIKPFPLQAECLDSTPWRKRLHLHKLDADSDRSRAKLRRHYAKLGFKHLRGTEFMFFFAGDALPRVADLEK